MKNDRLEQAFHNDLNMDYRGIAELGNDIYYLAGGMDSVATVSSKVLRLTWSNNRTATNNKTANKKVLFYPNPITTHLNFHEPLRNHIQLFNTQGILILTIPKYSKKINISDLSAGIYILKNRTHSYIVIKYE